MMRKPIVRHVVAAALFVAPASALAASVTPVPLASATVTPISVAPASVPAARFQQAPPPKAGQKPADPKAAAKAPATKPAPFVVAPVVPPPPGYVIGPDDVLQVVYWREKDVSAEATVRPDGMVSLPLLNDVKAAGLTPEQLRDAVNEGAKKYFEDPNVTIIVKTINSRKVFITGSVGKPGPYPLTAATTVLQLISMAGGLTEFADKKGISVMRTENGKPVRFTFNYKDVANGKNLKQNIELKPGDTVIVP
jgi:polysaccharide biosynthesis/export protein